MAFVKINPKQRLAGERSGGTRITIGAYLSEGVNKPRQIAFRIPQLVIAETNFQFDERARAFVGLHEGVGNDTGFLMIYQTEDTRDGTSIGRTHKEIADQSRHGYSVTFRFERFRYYAPNEWPMSATQVNHLIDDGNLIVECPDWFRPNIEKMKEDGLLKDKDIEKLPEVVNLKRRADQLVRRHKR